MKYGKYRHIEITASNLRFQDLIYHKYGKSCQNVPLLHITQMVHTDYLRRLHRTREAARFVQHSMCWSCRSATSRRPRWPCHDAVKIRNAADSGRLRWRRKLSARTRGFRAGGPAHDRDTRNSAAESGPHGSGHRLLYLDEPRHHVFCPIDSAIAIKGFRARLDPPAAGCKWQDTHWFELKRGPKPIVVAARHDLDIRKRWRGHL